MRAPTRCAIAALAMLGTACGDPCDNGDIYDERDVARLSGCETVEGVTVHQTAVSELVLPNLTGPVFVDIRDNDLLTRVDLSGITHSDRITVANNRQIQQLDLSGLVSLQYYDHDRNGGLVALQLPALRETTGQLSIIANPDLERIELSVWTDGRVQVSANPALTSIEAPLAPDGSDIVIGGNESLPDCVAVELTGASEGNLGDGCPPE